MRQVFATLEVVLLAGEARLGKPGLCIPQQRDGSSSQPRSTTQTMVPMPPGSPTHQGSDRSGWCGWREGPSQPDPELQTFLIKKFNIFSTWKQPVLQVGRGRVGKGEVLSEGPFMWECGFGEPPLLLIHKGTEMGQRVGLAVGRAAVLLCRFTAGWPCLGTFKEQLRGSCVHVVLQPMAE